MTFWSEREKIIEPVRPYRFRIMDAGVDLSAAGADSGYWWWAKSATKPSFEISKEEYQLINHKFKYPGIVTWADIDITIVDSKEFGNSKGLYGQLSKIGYNLTGEKDGISKTKAIGAKVKESDVDWQIQQLGADGKTIETWKLINPWIKSVKFGDLDYSSDDLVDITITISYDSATLS